MTRSRALKATPSAAATASQPDIEDLIKDEASVATIGAAVEPAVALVMQHEAARHDFPPDELLATRTALLVWYDAHRRKLPWRGDPPPYLTTAIHTSQKKKAAAGGKRGKLDAFWKAPSKGQEQQDAEEDAAADTKIEANAGLGEKLAIAPRKVEPYETWVSEIMLQQTRVDTVVDYFLRWLEKFPTVDTLANATEEVRYSPALHNLTELSDVNALWAGLGYYRRARMLHAGAKYVVANFGGELPSTVEQLLTIPGIGPYTAGAIASIAFRIREPLVDGNVIRVMARLRAIGADPKNKQLINFSWKAAKDLVGDCERPGALNQALMELGATVCTVQMSDGDKIPPFSKRKAFMDARLTELLGKSVVSRKDKANPQRRDVGELTHIFSHVKHHMGIEHLHFKAKPELLPSDEAQGLRWMTLAEMQQLGITTGVKKILELVLRSGGIAGDQKKKKRGAASSQVTHRKRSSEQIGRSMKMEVPWEDSVLHDGIPRIVALEIDSEAPTPSPSGPDRVIYFRDLASTDIPQVRALHEEWFPIRYNQAFYDGAAQGLWIETGGPLFARLAVEMEASTAASPVQPREHDRQNEHILGAVTASTLPLSKVDDPDLIAPDDWEHTHIMYILTLGTRSAVRRMGIASALLQECIAQASRQPACGAVYLHVKADNASARHFYEKNGFQNLRYLQGTAYRPGRPLFALLSIASFGWRKFVEGFTVEEFEDVKVPATSSSRPVDAASDVAPASCV
ncbi:hypothetical protein BBJ28_00013192 [Nothophytophthora sp. Chile5]|nr:hypothetical protein BBJ28_00013192 [Nothophytophthora sp. Chile5]